jgi:hypothetical protein
MKFSTIIFWILGIRQSLSTYHHESHANEVVQSLEETQIVYNDSYKLKETPVQSVIPTRVILPLCSIIRISIYNSCIARKLTNALPFLNHSI